MSGHGAPLHRHRGLCKAKLQALHPLRSWVRRRKHRTQLLCPGHLHISHAPNAPRCPPSSPALPRRSRLARRTCALVVGQSRRWPCPPAPEARDAATNICAGCVAPDFINASTISSGRRSPPPSPASAASTALPSPSVNGCVIAAQHEPLYDDPEAIHPCLSLLFRTSEHSPPRHLDLAGKFPQGRVSIDK